MAAFKFENDTTIKMIVSETYSFKHLVISEQLTNSIITLMIFSNKKEKSNINNKNIEGNVTNKIPIDQRK